MRGFQFKLTTTNFEGEYLYLTQKEINPIERHEGCPVLSKRNKSRSPLETDGSLGTATIFSTKRLIKGIFTVHY